MDVLEIWNFDNLDVSFIHCWHMTPISGIEVVSFLEILHCSAKFHSGWLEYHCLSCSNCRDILWNSVNINQSTCLGQLKLCFLHNLYPVYVNWHVASTFTNHRVSIKSQQNWLRQGVEQFTVISINLLFLSGIRRNCLRSGRSRPLYLFIRRTIKRTVVIRGAQFV